MKFNENYLADEEKKIFFFMLKIKIYMVFHHRFDIDVKMELNKVFLSDMYLLLVA